MSLSAEDPRLFAAILLNDADADAAAAVQQAIEDGANVNAVRNHWTPLLHACVRGYDQTLRILLGAGADARWRGDIGVPAISLACWYGHSSIVQLLINHDNGLLETVDDNGMTPLIVAIHQQHSGIVRFLLHSGADPHRVVRFGITALMYARDRDIPEIMQLLLDDRVGALFNAVVRNDADAAAAVQRAIGNGANVNAVRDGNTPLMLACERGFDQIIRILLDADADARWRDRSGWSAISIACDCGHLSTVQLLINHDNGLLQTVDNHGWTPLFRAISQQHSDLVRFLLDSGADPHHVNSYGWTTLITACRRDNLELVRLLLDAGVAVEACDELQQTALHHAAHRGHIQVVELIVKHKANMSAVENRGMTPLFCAVIQQYPDIVRFLLASGANARHVDQDGTTALMHACHFAGLEIVRLLVDAGVDVEASDGEQQTALHHAVSSGEIEVVRQLIVQHNANMFAEDEDGFTPFDSARITEQTTDVASPLLEMYGNKLTQDHGSLTLHVLLITAEYSFADEVEEFHPPLNPLDIILPLGMLTLMHLRYLLHTLNPELIRNRDDTGNLPIHIACQTNVPVEVLALILELDPAVLHIANDAGALPIHLLCGTTTAASEYASVRYLVEQGGVGTLAARNQQGASPLHLLCGSTNPPLRVVQYLIQSFPRSVAMRTNAGQYPFMVAADSSSASLSVIYELVRANPDLVVPR